VGPKHEREKYLSISHTKWPGSATIGLFLYHKNFLQKSILAVEQYTSNAGRLPARLQCLFSFNYHLQLNVAYIPCNQSMISASG